MAPGFHPAGAGSLQRSTRCVQPHITAGHHLAGDMDVVIFQEDQASLQVAELAKVNDMLDVALAGIVSRMSFAGKNELHGTGLIPREFDDILKLLENQWSAFIGGK